MECVEKANVNITGIKRISCDVCGRNIFQTVIIDRELFIRSPIQHYSSAQIVKDNKERGGRKKRNNRAVTS